MQLLVSRGARRGLPDCDGRDALEIALANGHQAIAELLESFDPD